MLPMAFQSIVARLVGAGINAAKASKIAQKAEWVGEQVYNAKHHNQWNFDTQNMKLLQRELEELPIPELQKFARTDLNDVISIAANKQR